jgi:hypothetical protein
LTGSFGGVPTHLFAAAALVNKRDIFIQFRDREADICLGQIQHIVCRQRQSGESGACGLSMQNEHAD